MKRKSTKQLPAVSEAEVAAFLKSEAVLLRLTTQDKQAIVAAASTLHLTVTELDTRSALMVAAKVPK